LKIDKAGRKISDKTRILNLKLPGHPFPALFTGIQETPIHSVMD